MSMTYDSGAVPLTFLALIYNSIKDVTSPTSTIDVLKTIRITFL